MTQSRESATFTSLEVSRLEPFKVDLLGVIRNFNSEISTIEVLNELNEMSNDRSLSHHYILSRFAEITGNDHTFNRRFM